MASGRRNTIEHWSRHGIAGRGVVLDLVRTLGEAGRPYEIGTSTTFGVDDLEQARKRAGVEFRPGDILLLHTGFAAWYVGQPPGERFRVARAMTTPGDRRRARRCAGTCGTPTSPRWPRDTFAVEAFPPAFGEPPPGGFLHRMLIGQFGMALGELWWLEDLAADCADDGVYEVFLVSAPLNAPGGIGSPPNAVAIK